MIVEYIRYEVRDPDTFVGAYEKAREALDASAECRAYELSRCVEARSTFILRIEWSSVDGHLTGFRASPEFKTFFEAVKPFVGEIREMRHYELIGVVSRKS